MDQKLEQLFGEYIAINNDEKEGNLEKAAQDIRDYQAKLLEEQGHMGVDEEVIKENDR